MHSHLAIIGKNGELALNTDQSLNVTEKNPMFNDVEMFSQTFSLPFNKNRQLLKNMEARDSSMRAIDIENERFKIVLEGLPARSAILKVGEDIVLNDSIDVNLEATNRTFKEMIQDLRCRDVTVDDDILIGEKVGDVQVKINYQTEWRQRVQVDRPTPGDPTDPSDRWTSEIGVTKIYEKPKIVDAVFQPPVLGFSYPGKCKTREDGIEALHGHDQERPDVVVDGHTVIRPELDETYINTVHPYPVAKYCNSRVCYSHHAKKGNDKDGYETDDALVTNGEATPSDGYNFGPYWVLPAERPASGICFYVAYFLECLFKHLGLAYDMTVLTDIEDFNYLCFFNTACKVTTENTDLRLTDIEQVNLWLSSRGCGGQINIDLGVLEQEILLNTIDQRSDDYHKYLTLTADEVESCDDFLVLEKVPEQPSYRIKMENADGSVGPLVTFSEWPCEYSGWTYQLDRTYSVARANSCNVSAVVQRMYATSDNFPGVNVSEVIESLENSFGVRFCYDAELNKVTVRLLRDMFRDQQPPIHFKGEILSMLKVSEKITGVRMGYSAESDKQEQRDNIRYQKKDYDTTYDYMEYPQNRTKLAAYRDVLKVIDIGNMNCYVDLATGDAFRVKIDADAKTTAEMKPSLFEVGSMHSVELGDCSKDNENYVREFLSSFEPIITNNLKREVPGEIIIVPFVDEDMEHEFLPMTVQNVFVVSRGEIYANYQMQLAENYDPTSTEDGQSPLMSYDWGLTVGFLRPGAGSNSVYEYDRDYDGFGNSRWAVTSEEYAISADSYDVYGHFLGTSPAGSFSLKPAAYKPFRYYYDEQEKIHISTNPKEWDDLKWLVPCNNDIINADGTIASRIRSRGMCDTWMAEFFRFLMQRQRYEVKAICSAAELIDIPNRWLRRWEIDGKVGWINKFEYSVDEQTGIGETTIDFFSM